ncbi:VC2046/SO_2500 family protein [uncultured Paraglaciecola sp.]|uniref:VC2046/SO_2500 family protein n=1 Tax=uncultured Paraglaciecola sp. TaxID=1765024 RepID=UPI0030DD880C
MNTSQSDLNTTNEALLSSDYELNGTINRASGEGAKFALLLAMLEQDCTHRPHIQKNQEINANTERKTDLNYYRSSPLSANDSYWQTCQHTSDLIHKGQIQSAHLWLAMHPEPLSQHNKADDIDAEVIANCSLAAQTRLEQTKQKALQVDETGLYDILQQLDPVSA